jgi:hypothetical protein
VAPPIEVELKGLDAPVALYELRGLGGRFAQRLPEAGGDDGVEVELPLAGAVIQGKRVHAGAFAGTVRRLGRRSLEAAVDVELAALTNVRLRLTYPDPPRESGDVYGKVTGAIDRGRVRLTRIHLTSVNAGDQAILERVLVAAAAPKKPGTVSNATEEPR